MRNGLGRKGDGWGGLDGGWVKWTRDGWDRQVGGANRGLGGANER